MLLKGQELRVRTVHFARLRTDVTVYSADPTVERKLVSKAGIL